MSNLKIIIPAVIIFIVAISGLYYLYQTQTSSRLTSQTSVNSSPKNYFPEASASATPSNIKGVQNQNVPGSQPSTGSEYSQDLQTIILVTSPQPSSLVSSPVKIEGSANVTSQIVYISVKDANGKILGTGKASACLNYKPCDFSTSVVFSQPQTAAGSIEAYSLSTIDRSPQDKATIAVNFK